MTKESKNTRFEKMLDNYATALYLSYQLIDSGLLEKKIKIGVDTDKINGLVRLFTPAFANNLRHANKIIRLIKSTHDNDEYFGSAVDIANAYFDELHIYGGEWEHADLQDLFYDYKVEAENELAEAKETD